MSLSYTWQKLSAAVDVLAESDYPRWQRLATAMVMMEPLRRAGRSASDFPTPELRQRFDALQDKLSARGSFEDTIKTLGVIEISDAIREILKLFEEVAKALGVEEAEGRKR
jgi:hypothetical protein